MTTDPAIRLIRKQSGKKKRGKHKKLCPNCLDGFMTAEQRKEGFRVDFISCARWKTVVHITHARICPYYISVRRPVKKTRRRW